jgi:hypothetical protein
MLKNGNKKQLLEVFQELVDTTGLVTISVESLLVSVWKKHPIDFGLRGYETCHPDARKLATCLYGSKGLIQQGYLLVGAAGLLSLAKPVVSSTISMTTVVNNNAPPLSLCPAEEIELQRLLTDVVYTEYVTNHTVTSIPFRDCLAFWGMLGKDACLFQDTYDGVQRLLDKLLPLPGCLPAELSLSSGQHIGQQELTELLKLNASLKTTHLPHLQFYIFTWPQE